MSHFGSARIATTIKLENVENMSDIMILFNHIQIMCGILFLIFFVKLYFIYWNKIVPFNEYIRENKF